MAEAAKNWQQASATAAAMGTPALASVLGSQWFSVAVLDN